MRPSEGDRVTGPPSQPRRTARRDWRAQALTTLVLYNCSSLTTLPARSASSSADGARLAWMLSLAVLPAAIGELGALTTLACTAVGLETCRKAGVKG